jgi:predicted DNA-binding transcriptional regulator AlpA
MKRRVRPNARFLTLRDAEAEYGVSYAMLYTWVNARRLPRLDADVAGRSILIRRADLEAFLDANMTEARS